MFFNKKGESKIFSQYNCASIWLIKKSCHGSFKCPISGIYGLQFLEKKIFFSIFGVFSTLCSHISAQDEAFWMKFHTHDRLTTPNKCRNSNFWKYAHAQFSHSRQQHKNGQKNTFFAVTRAKIEISTRNLVHILFSTILTTAEISIFYTACARAIKRIWFFAVQPKLWKNTFFAEFQPRIEILARNLVQTLFSTFLPITENLIFDTAHLIKIS